MQFVIHDPHLGGFWKWITQRVRTPQEAKVWKSRAAAIKQAAAGNATRNIPPGCEDQARYQDLPNLVVQEYDEQWRLLATHEAKPSYLTIDSAKIDETDFPDDGFGMAP